MKTVNKHLLNALDNYPYSLTDTIESLEYALSYDDKNTTALCLLGRIYTDQLTDYETAKDFFAEAISYDIHALGVYPYYIHTLILNEDYEEAEKLMDFAMTLKGMDKVEILFKKAWMKEILCEFESVRKILKEIKQINCHSGNNSVLDEIKARIDLKTKKRKAKKR